MFYKMMAAVCLVGLICGCDRTEPTNPQASQSSPAPAQQTVSTYRTTVQPLVDELLRIESLIVNPATLDFDEFDKRVKEMNFARAKADAGTSDGEKAQESFKAITAATADVNKAHVIWKETDRLKASVSNMTLDEKLKALRLGMEGEELRIKSLVDALVNIASVKGLWSENK